MSKKRRAKQPLPQTRDDLDAVCLVQYEITSAPIEDRAYKRLPRQAKDALERLHFEAQRRPHKAIPELREWIDRYPHIPQFYNYLSVAYSRAGRRGEAEAAIQENYEQNPDYLFARLNYAELCLARRDYDKVAEIFENKFDLKLLYPKRKRFHISEVANFMGMVGVYFFEIGEREKAKRYYDIVHQIAPGYPMVRRLHRKLSPNLLQRLWRRLTRQSGARKMANTSKRARRNQAG